MTKKARLHNVEKTVSSPSGAGKTGRPHVKRMKFDNSLTPYTEISSTWIEDLNVSLDSIKFLEENIGRTLFNINRSNIFFNLSLSIMEIKSKNKQTGPT